MGLAPKKRISSNKKQPDLRIERHDNLDSYFKGKNDSEIWDMFREGHVGAFRFIYMNYFNLLLSYGCRITKHTELVKDCIQDLFVELKRSNSLSSTNSIKFYLFRALRWKIYRKIENGNRLFSLEEMESSFEMDYEEPYESVLIRTQTFHIQKEKMKLAIPKLTKRQKEALYYYYEQNFDYRQVADIMKLSNKKSARNIIYRAIGELRKLL